MLIGKIVYTACVQYWIFYINNFTLHLSAYRDVRNTSYMTTEGHLLCLKWSYICNGIHICIYSLQCGHNMKWIRSVFQYTIAFLSSVFSKCENNVHSQAHFSDSDTLWKKNADMQSIDFAGARVIFNCKCIPGTATVASNRFPWQNWSSMQTLRWVHD